MLVFSSIGYVTQEVSPGNREVLNVTLKIAEAKLNDVVVVGYGTVRKADITGAVGSVV
jgi:hypothetical protein